MPIPPRGSSALLRSGSINLMTGDSKYFNVIENMSRYGQTEGALFLLKKRTTYMKNQPSDFIVVSGAGSHTGYHTFQTGSHPMMHHDQSGNQFTASYEVVIQGPTSLETLKGFYDRIGYKSVPFYVFK